MRGNIYIYIYINFLGGAVNVENYEGEPLEEGSVNIVKGSVTPSGCISYIDSFPFDPKTYGNYFYEKC